MSIKTLKAEINFKGISSEVEYEYTNHFSKRSQQRAITEDEVKYALSEGQEVEKQGLIFYIIGDKVTKKVSSPQKRKKLKNLVVVTSADENVLITTYRNNNPFKHIAKKPKRLCVAA
tara:strand:- start:76 stop:426 length:351 start_codon:yes stop_codon:yes gene_type:complete